MNYSAIKKGLIDSLQVINKTLDLIEAEEKLLAAHQPELPGISPPISTPPAQSPLIGKQIALIPGHEPGGGAEGERAWNIDVALYMHDALVKLGADPIIYYHNTRAYSQRMLEMNRNIKALQPNNWVCIELHYDDVDIPGPSGHHFQYLGSKLLASSFRDTWQAKYNNSIAKRDNGIMYNNDQNGSGFLRNAPGWAVLCEPFFRSNPTEWAYFKDKQLEVSQTYVKALELFAKRQLSPSV